MREDFGSDVGQPLWGRIALGKERSFIGSARVISICTLVSRVLGLVRDMLTAAVFGARLCLDAFLIAFAIPNFFRRLFGEGGLSSAFIPTFADELEKKGSTSARQLVAQVGSALALTLAGIVVVGEIVFALILLVLRLTARGPLTKFVEKFFLILRLLQVLFPYLLFICLVAFAAAVLHSFKHFALPALSPVLMNLFWIGGVLIVAGMAADEGGAQVMVLAVVLLSAGVFQLMMQLPMLARKGMLAPPTTRFDHPGVRRVAGLMAPVMFGLAVVQVNVLVDMLIAFFLVPGEGAPTVLFFGNRLMQFPLALIGIAIATAVFPSLAGAASKNDEEELKRLVRQAMRVSLFLAIPAGCGLMALAGPIVTLVFQRRNFDEWAALRTSSVVFFYGLGLWAYCLQHVLVRAFYSLKDVTTPVKVASGMVVLNLVLNLTLVWPMQESGLALSTALTAMAQFGVLLHLLRKRLGGLGIKEMASSIINTLSAASVMAGICLLLPTGISGLLTEVTGRSAQASVVGRATVALVPIAVGAGVYLLLARLFRMTELAEVLGWRGRARK